MRAILVCVEYDDFLAITLPYNRHHFSEVMVVTTPDDLATHQIAIENKAQLYITRAFYEDGAAFNKWRALEQGLDHFGRTGLMCIMDADVLWPKQCTYWNYQPGYLYTPKRRMCAALQADANGEVTIPPEHTWQQYPYHRYLKEWSGYTQVFYATDHHLPVPPWHQTDWIHAGGADSAFQRRWPSDKKLRPGFEVLHLGSGGRNWCGRVTARIDTGQIPAEARSREQRLAGVMRSRRAPPSKQSSYAAERTAQAIEPRRS